MMNIFNFTVHNSTSSDIVGRLAIAEDVIIYIIRGISAFGALFNLTTILILFKKSKFQHKFYDFLQCRCVCNLCVCLLLAYYVPLVCRGCEADYTSLIVNLFVIQFPLRMILMASSVSDNLLIYNRLVNLYQRTNSIYYNLSKKVRV